VTRTITLTDRAPVAIVEADWPELAAGRYSFDRESLTTVAIRVRQHADGRTLVYGTDHRTGPDGYTSRAGRLLDARESTPESLAATIILVGQDLCAMAGSECADIQRAVRACLADLPAERI
jgi:hypothetical protein